MGNVDIDHSNSGGSSVDVIPQRGLVVKRKFTFAETAQDRDDLMPAPLNQPADSVVSLSIMWPPRT